MGVDGKEGVEDGKERMGEERNEWEGRRGERRGNMRHWL